MRLDSVARTSPPSSVPGADRLDELSRAGSRSDGVSLPSTLGSETVALAATRSKALAASAVDRVQGTLGTAWDVGQRIVEAMVQSPQFVQRQIDGLSTLVDWMYPVRRIAAPESAAVTPIAPTTPAPAPSAPRTIEDVQNANRAAPGGGANGDGDLGGKYTALVRAPFGPEGSTDAERGQAAIERTLADTAVGSQIQNDEFEIIGHDNGKYTIVLPGVIDLSSPHWGLDDASKSVRDIDQTALGSSVNSRVESNLYAMMVRDYVLDPKNGIPTGADVMLVGHSLGGDTVLDLASDPVFNNAQTGVNVTHVVSAAYFNQPELDRVPASTQVLVLQNNRDVPVIAEGLGYTATESRRALGRLIDGAERAADGVAGMGSSLLTGDFAGVVAHGGDLTGQARRMLTPDALPVPDAAALTRTGVRGIDGHIVEARFAGGAQGAGHHQQNYIDYVNGGVAGDPDVSRFMASVSSSGYAAPGQTNAVDISVDDPAYTTTYPGDGLVNDALGVWNALPGAGIAEGVMGAGIDAVDAGVRLAGDAGSALWSNRSLLGDARDGVRDAAVRGWNVVPGNDAVEGFLGDVVEVLPFNNVVSAGFQELTGSSAITLEPDAVQAIQRDPDFTRTEQAIVHSIEQRDGYGSRAMEIPLRDLGVDLGLELGGQRGESAMSGQLLRLVSGPAAWDADVVQTLGVASRELTWLVRHAQLDGTAHVAEDGSISIDYSVHDKLDLRPSAGRSDMYNVATTVTGTLWHDVLGAEAAEIDGRFSRTGL